MLTAQQVKFVGQYIGRNAPHHGYYWRLRHAKTVGWAVLRSDGGQMTAVGTLSEYPTHEEALAVVSTALQLMEIVEIPIARLGGAGAAIGGCGRVCSELNIPRMG